MTSNFISKDTINRLISDIKEIKRESLELNNEHNIYYEHDQENILKGYALIIGAKNTPYQYGAYLFEFNFPSDYPYKPPVITYYTLDKNTRFNPNLYTNGKVCLSVLNTWKGDQWTSCQTIKSILLTLITVLNDKPLLNEPGLTEKHKDFNNYHESIKYKNIEVGIYKMLTKESLPQQFEIFYDIIKERYIKNKFLILSFLQDNINKDKVNIRCIYNMHIQLNYKSLLNKFNNLKLN